jgi:hypothetical protein
MWSTLANQKSYLSSPWVSSKRWKWVKLAILIEIHPSRRHFIRVGKIAIVGSGFVARKAWRARSTRHSTNPEQNRSISRARVASRLAFPLLATPPAPGSASTSNYLYDDFEASLVYRRCRCERRGSWPRASLSSDALALPASAAHERCWPLADDRERWQALVDGISFRCWTRSYGSFLIWQNKLLMWQFLNMAA